MPSKTLQDQYDSNLASIIRVPKSARVPLVYAFQTLFKSNKKEALRVVNRACKTNYNVRRYREWERGATEIPRGITIFMQQRVVKAKFGKQATDLLKLLNLQGPNIDLL